MNLWPNFYVGRNGWLTPSNVGISFREEWQNSRTVNIVLQTEKSWHFSHGPEKGRVSWFPNFSMKMTLCFRYTTTKSGLIRKSVLRFGPSKSHFLEPKTFGHFCRKCPFSSALHWCKYFWQKVWTNKWRKAKKLAWNKILNEMHIWPRNQFSALKSFRFRGEFDTFQALAK